MADKSFPVLRATDGKILAFFDALRDRFQFTQSYNVHVVALDATLSPAGPETEKLKEQNAYAIRNVSIARNQAYVNYDRSNDTSRFNTPDTVRITNNGNNLSFAELIGIRSLIAEVFEQGIPGTPGDPDTLGEVLASHQLIVTRLEESLERMSTRFTEERLKAQQEQTEFVRAKEEEFANREATLRAAISADREKVAAREKALDNRTNMHARRGIREDMKRRLQEHATQFTLTNSTRLLRWPIHVVILCSVAALIWAILHYTQQYDTTISQLLKAAFDPTFSPRITLPPSLLYPPLIKVSLLSVAAIGLITWYIRWLNRWFDRHAEAEFRLKQFELDVDRASWVVETAMEWRASEHGVIPSHLLESISRNLFSSQESKPEDSITAADYLASAILGSAASAKLKVGENELTLDRKGVKQLQKE